MSGGVMIREENVDAHRLFLGGGGGGQMGKHETMAPLPNKKKHLQISVNFHGKVLANDGIDWQEVWCKAEADPGGGAPPNLYRLYRVAHKKTETVDTVGFQDFALINSYIFHLAG